MLFIFGLEFLNSFYEFSFVEMDFLEALYMFTFWKFPLPDKLVKLAFLFTGHAYGGVSADVRRGYFFETTKKGSLLLFGYIGITGIYVFNPVGQYASYFS